MGALVLAAVAAMPMSVGETPAEAKSSNRRRSMAKSRVSTVSRRRTLVVRAARRRCRPKLIQFLD